MTKERIYAYFINRDFNCAESMLHALNDEYDLQIPDHAFKLIGGFGGGMACGKNCGALCGGCAALGWAMIQDRAHTTPGLREAAAEYAVKFTRHFGSDRCDCLSPVYKKPDTRCLQLLEQAADIFDQVWGGINIGK